jgi:type VI secretion system protein ImpK
MLHEEELDDALAGSRRREPHGDPLDSAPASEGPAPDTRVAPGAETQERLATVMAAQNPLLEAAQPLLRALADMPVSLGAEGLIEIHRLLEREVASLQSICSSAHIRHEHAVAASYCLCTALDEAANSTEWGGGKGGEAGVWAGQQLAAKFHGDTKGGDKFFLLVGRLAASPQEHIDLLELMYQILGLGFEGRFGAAANGRRQLETVRHRLFGLLGTARGEVPQDLSPHWKGVGAGRFRLLRSVPVWVTASLLAMVLFGLFAWYKYQLLQLGNDVEARIAAIGRMRPPPAPPGKPLRLKELLAPEIARGTVSVDEDDRRSAVTFKGDDMFVPGQARLSARILPVLAKVADEINQVSGSVRVTGHSDNQPIKTREFPDNQVLSEKRAAAVAAVLLGKGVVASRLRTEGRGDTAPIADSATASGRAKNRRVDIVVTQDDGNNGATSQPTHRPAVAR